MNDIKGPHPRLLLERAEIRYLDENGWVQLIGGKDEKCVYAPEDTEYKSPMTQDEAVIEQKRRDVK